MVSGRPTTITSTVHGVTTTTQDPWANDGIVVGGNVHLKTLQENSAITLSAAGNLSVLAPAWTQELTTDAFTQYADGQIVGTSSFMLSINLGTRTVSKLITVSNTATTGIAALRDAVQAAISSTPFDPNGTPITITGADNDPNQFKVRLNDGKLMFTSNFKFTLSAGRAAAPVVRESVVAACSSCWVE